MYALYWRSLWLVLRLIPSCLKKDHGGNLGPCAARGSVDVGSFVPQITEDGVDVVQLTQDRVQNRTQEQIVGMPVRDKITIWEKIVEATQPVPSTRKQVRGTLREHTLCKDDTGDVPVPSRPDHIPLQRIWCIFDEDVSAPLEDCGRVCAARHGDQWSSGVLLKE